MIEVDYLFPADADADKLAKVIAVGQTAGSWSEKYTEHEARLKEHLGEVREVRAVEGGQCATVVFPQGNVEGDLGTLLTMIFGKFSILGTGRIVGLRLPEDSGLRPRFGMRGLREKVSVAERPLLMAIFKPQLGLSASDLGPVLRDAAEAGLDLVKDDEIMPDLPSAPMLKRVEVCRNAIEASLSVRKRDLLYAVNVTGRADQVLQRARDAVSAGAHALLFNPLTHGLSVLEALRADDKVNVPLFAHPAFAGAISGSPAHGVSYGVLLGALLAHSGADAVLYPSHVGSLPFSETDEREVCDALRARGVAPVPSAGIKPVVIPDLHKFYGNEVVFNAGTAIMDHPEGAGAGVKTFFDTIEALA